MEVVAVDSLWRCETCRNVINGVCNTWCDNGEGYKPSYPKMETFEAKIEKRAEWVKKPDGFLATKIICSVCGGWEHRLTYEHEGMNYCPNCGAKIGD